MCTSRWRGAPARPADPPLQLRLRCRRGKRRVADRNPQNLLPWWLSQYPSHPLAAMDPAQAARSLRGFAVGGDELALAIFRQQATAIGRLLTICMNVIDPDVCFVGGGVLEADAAFRERYLADVRAGLTYRKQQSGELVVTAVPDLDMAGARGAALAAQAAPAPRVTAAHDHAQDASRDRPDASGRAPGGRDPGRSRAARERRRPAS